MILSEKPGRESFSEQLGNLTAISGKRLIEKNDSCTFSDVIDKACEGLMDRQIKHTIRRIREMEKYLSDMERELDEFLIMKNEELGMRD